MQTNFWALGDAAVGIPLNVDMNSYLSPGNYACRANSTAATLSNCPTVMAFQLKVSYVLGNTSIIQQEYTDVSGRQYIRQYDNYTKKWISTEIATKEELENIKRNRISIPDSRSVTVKSNKVYDIILFVGQYGGKAILDVVPLNNVGAKIIHLGDINATLDSITNQSVRVQIEKQSVCTAIGLGVLSME